MYAVKYKFTSSFLPWRHSFPKSGENSEHYTCRPRFMSSCVISLAQQRNAYHMTSIVKYDRTCQRSIKIIIIGKTFVLHKSAQKKHIFREFFIIESSWWALFNHLKTANFEKWWFFTLDDTLRRSKSLECSIAIAVVGRFLVARKPALVKFV